MIPAQNQLTNCRLVTAAGRASWLLASGQRRPRAMPLFGLRRTTSCLVPAAGSRAVEAPVEDITSAMKSKDLDGPLKLPPPPKEAYMDQAGNTRTPRRTRDGEGVGMAYNPFTEGFQKKRPPILRLVNALSRPLCGEKPCWTGGSLKYHAALRNW